MTQDSKTWKVWVRRAIAFVLVLDALLLIVVWREAGANPKTQRAQRDRLAEQHRRLESDVRKALEIRDHLPAVQQECDRFVKTQLVESAGGYSTVVEDLGQIAKEAGLQTSGINFKQDLLEKRGVTQLRVTATVEGDYSSLVRFINGLERSENFYLLDSLTLAASSSGGSIRLNLELRSYFRS